MPELRIPAFTGSESKLEAAEMYAAAGWYLLPTAPGSKNPGSVVGEGWQHGKSSRDPAQLRSWFSTQAGSRRGIALDCGRSGAVVLDVDHPENYREGTHSSAQQQTRDDQPDRRHHVFAMPPGRAIGGSLGELRPEPGKPGWGEVRAVGGVIMAWPSTHPETGGQYTWVSGQGEPVPVLPESTARKLPDRGPRSAAAVDVAAAMAYLQAHLSRGQSDPRGVAQLVAWYAQDVTDGASRHEAFRSQCLKAMRWAAAGKVQGVDALDALTAAFMTDLTTPNGDRRVVDTAEASAEAVRTAVWAIGEVQGEQERQADTRAEAGGLEDDDDTEPMPPGGLLEKLRAARLNVTSGAATYDVPLPEAAIKDTLVWSGVGQIYGDTQAGKSLVAWTLAVAIADTEQAEWFGRKVKRHGHVFYVLYEGEAGFAARISAWRKGTGREVPDTMHVVHDPPWDLHSQTGADDMVEELKALAGGDDVALVVLDTQILAFAGIDFNNNAEMAKVWLRLKRAARRANTLILTVAHTPKASRGTTIGTASGAGTQLDSSDQAIYVTFDAETKNRAVQVVKVKDFAPWPEPFGFMVERETLGTDSDGDPIVFPWAKPTGPLSDPGAPDDSAHNALDQVVLEALDVLGGRAKLKELANHVHAHPSQAQTFDADQTYKAVENAINARLIPRHLVHKPARGVVAVGGLPAGLLKS